MVSQLSPTDAWRIAASVTDPEVPVLTIADLGILRDVEVHGRDAEASGPTGRRSGSGSARDGCLEPDGVAVHVARGAGCRRVRRGDHPADPEAEHRDRAHGGEDERE